MFGFGHLGSRRPIVGIRLSRLSRLFKPGQNFSERRSSAREEPEDPGLEDNVAATIGHDNGRQEGRVRWAGTPIRPPLRRLSRRRVKIVQVLPIANDSVRS